MKTFGMINIAICFVIGILVLSSGCKEKDNVNNHNISNPAQYKIVKGACGSVVFQEEIGTDFETAYSELAKRKSYEFSKYCPAAPCNEIELESFEIEVADENDVKPIEQFYAIRVLDKHTKMLLHSVSEVITSSGNLYKISWCPD